MEGGCGKWRRCGRSETEAKWKPERVKSEGTAAVEDSTGLVMAPRGLSSAQPQGHATLGKKLTLESHVILSMMSNVKHPAQGWRRQRATILDYPQVRDGCGAVSDVQQ